MTSPPKDTETVALAGSGVAVARRSTHSHLTPIGPDRHAVTEVTIELDDAGQPWLASVRYLGPRDGRADDVHPRLELERLKRWAYEAAITRAILRGRLEDEGVHEDGVSYLDLDDDELAAVFSQARTAATPRGPYKLTDEFLAGVLEQHREGGVPLVAKQRDVSERTVRRWLREARERGLR